MNLLSNFMILKNKNILNNQLTKTNTNKEVVGRFMPENASELFPNGVDSKTNDNENNFQEFTKDDVPDVPIYFQGWIKYIKYLDDGISSRPKRFFKNDYFDKQTTPSTESDEVYFSLHSMVL